MHATRRALQKKKHLLLAFDAFGTLFEPSSPIPHAYSNAASRYGINCADDDYSSHDRLKKSFSRAFKEESRRNPNYGKAAGLGAEKWWGNLIQNTFEEFLQPGQKVPQELINDLLTRFSTKEGYHLFPDVVPFFRMLRSKSMQQSINPPWRWDKTAVGIITNSDDRVPSVLESFGLNVGPRRIGTSVQRSTVASSDEDISFVVLSYDVGFEKPDRRVFDAATDMLRETLAESGTGADGAPSIDDFEKLYVGDSLVHDYYGAEGAGWNALLLDRRRESEALKEHAIARLPASNANMEREFVSVINHLGALSRWLPA